MSKNKNKKPKYQQDEEEHNMFSNPKVFGRVEINCPNCDEELTFTINQEEKGCPNCGTTVLNK